MMRARLQNLPIATKIRLVVIIAAASALLLTMLALGALETYTYREQLVNRSSSLAQITAANAVGATEFQDRATAERVVRALSSEISIQRAELLGLDGAVLARFTRANDTKEPSIDALNREHAAAFGGELMFDHAHVRHAFHGTHLDVAAPVVLGDETIGFVRIEASLVELYTTLFTYGWIALIVSLSALASAYFATFRLQRAVAAPLVSLVRLMRRVSEHQDYEVRAEKVGNDEIGALIDGFNQMLAQVRERDVRLEEHRQYLERQVAERTAHLEEALAAARQASRAKSDFLARMSHEIRTPMNGVLGMAELLQNTSLDARQRRLLGTVYRSAESLLQIINDILDFSKVEAGRLELQPQTFHLREVVEETVEMLAERAHAKRLELACAVAGNVPIWVTGDPLRLRQILVNLIGNAIKFTQRGEVVVRVAIAHENGRIRFAIQDTGPGIPMHMHERIFDAFTQLDAFTTRQYGGTGLGLAIARQLVQLMRGDIGVSSSSAGSLFWFEAPLPPVAEPTSMRVPRTSIAGARVLIADDNDTNREILTQSLTEAGVHVTTANNGQEAIEAALAAVTGPAPFDLLILDHKMPVLDGITCVRRLREHAETANTRIVLLSSIEMALDFGESEALRIDESLTKPIRQARLHAAVARSLGREISGPGQAPSRAPSSSWSQSLQGAHVLLVEDNDVNREVALGMLAALGCKTQVAEHGGIALDRCRQRRWDAVLMDCHMPIMDGFTAVAELRTLEAREQWPRVPVIALTANAMEGDRDRCMAAGMDDFLSKPFTLAQLCSVLEKWIAIDRQLQETTVVSIETLDPKAIDAIRMIPAPDLLERMVRLYNEHTPRLIQEARAAIEAQDAARLAVAAHELKSASTNLGAQRLARLCKDCEAAARRGDLAAAQSLWQQAAEEYPVFRAALAALPSGANAA